jgi:hypothetical protein
MLNGFGDGLGKQFVETAQMRYVKHFSFRGESSPSDLPCGKFSVKTDPKRCPTGAFEWTVPMPTAWWHQDERTVLDGTFPVMEFDDPLALFD